jgi:methionine-rich copper-binding protein CopC
MQRSALPVAAAAAASLLASQAFAHAQLVKADPKVGSTVASAPDHLWLRFDEVLRLGGSGVQLVYPDGRAVLLSPLRQDPKDVRAVVAPLPAKLPPGRYEVRWRALSPDAHHTQGDFSFTVGG